MPISRPDNEMLTVSIRLLEQVFPTEVEDDGTPKKDRRSRQYVDKPQFSLPVMSANFRRFNARYGDHTGVSKRRLVLLMCSKNRRRLRSSEPNDPPLHLAGTNAYAIVPRCLYSCLSSTCFGSCRTAGRPPFLCYDPIFPYPSSSSADCQSFIFIRCSGS